MLGRSRHPSERGRFFDIKKENRITFNELLDAYTEKAKDEKYFNTSIRHFIPIIREHFEGKLISEIDYKALEDFRDGRKKTPTQYGTPRSDRTVNLEMAILRDIFRKGLK